MVTVTIIFKQGTLSINMLLLTIKMSITFTIKVIVFMCEVLYKI